MKQKKLKPRDPFVIHLISRPSGPMGKSKKALRRQAKLDIKFLKHNGDF